MSNKYAKPEQQIYDKMRQVRIDEERIDEAVENDLTKIPAAACIRCGGWTKSGGMSKHADDKSQSKKNLGRTGCQCKGGNAPAWAKGKKGKRGKWEK
jgi:hypothetical protein